MNSKTATNTKVCIFSDDAEFFDPEVFDVESGDVEFGGVEVFDVASGDVEACDAKVGDSEVCVVESGVQRQESVTVPLLLSCFSNIH